MSASNPSGAPKSSAQGESDGMTSRQPSEQAIKSRIINHMNADHVDSLTLFLRHYNKVPTHLIGTPKITEVSLGHMIIESGKGHARYFTPIDPPMTNLAEARTRMVNMHQTALEGLQIPSITIPTYLPPTGFHLVVFVACTLTYILFSTPQNFLPPTSTTPFYHRLVYTTFTLNHTYPQIARFLALIQPILITAMVLIHTIEAIYFHTTRLRKYLYSTGLAGRKVYMQWLVSNFIEGVGAIQRFDGLAKELEKKDQKKDGVKH